MYINYSLWVEPSMSIHEGKDLTIRQIFLEDEQIYKDELGTFSKCLKLLVIIKAK